jgi:hypothetical protein
MGARSGLNMAAARRLSGGLRVVGERSEARLADCAARSPAGRYGGCLGPIAIAGAPAPYAWVLKHLDMYRGAFS